MGHHIRNIYNSISEPLTFRNTLFYIENLIKRDFSSYSNKIVTLHIHFLISILIEYTE